MDRERLIKVSGAFLSITILIVLIMSAPAQAFISGLTSSSDVVFRGDKINLFASVNLDINETLAADYFILKLKAKDSVPFMTECRFLENGTIISGCSGVSITKLIITTQYGYVDLNSIAFNITLDTKNYIPAAYSTSLIISYSGKISEQAGPDLTIKPVNAKLKDSCSIRARDSSVNVNGKEFANTKLNFYIPLRNAATGQGYLIGQKARETFNYEFKNVKILDNDDETILFLLISGKYKIGIGEKIPENAIISLNKKTNKVSILGDKINIKDMDVTFKIGCE